MARRLLAAAAASALAVSSLADAGAAEAAVDSALSWDDQCRAGDAECALNALQMRGAKKAQEAQREHERARASAARVASAIAAHAAANATEGSERYEACSLMGCNANFQGGRACQCNAACLEYGNCCYDHSWICKWHYQLQANAHSDVQDRECAGDTQGFKLNMKAEGASFFDQFTFVGVDDVHGAHQFTSKSEAHQQQVISTGDVAQLKFGGIRQPSFDGEAKKRYAVNLHTNKAWDPANGFLAVMHYKQIPFGCGIWPSFWAMNSDRVWPGGGELDIMEFASYSPNKVTFHISGACELDTEKVSQCAPMGQAAESSTDCETNYFINKLGCMPKQRQPDGEFFSKNPGVLAAEWTSRHIIVYHIPEAQIPADLTSEKPDTTGWKNWILAYLPLKPDCKSAVGPQELVLNMQLCGDWAGATFGTHQCGGVGWNYLHGCNRGLSQPSDCCTKYVTDESQDSYLRGQSWDIKSLKVFTKGGGGATDSGTFKRGGVPLKA